MENARVRTRQVLCSATTIGMLVASLTVAGTAARAAAPSGSSVTIDAPASPRAGVVELTGTVGAAPGEVTTVLYVYDATRSTSMSSGSDCSGDGAVGAADDLNGDGSIGDVLDCEIAGVTALNRSLGATSGVQAGLVAFADAAAAADLDPIGSATFLPPGFTGGDPRPRIETVASSVVQGRIGLYDTKELGGSGSGTAFNSAIATSLAVLGTAPAGPKWIMFLSDGQSPIDDGLLAQLGQSGVRLRTFGIGEDATCDRFSSLYKMAAATGESCQTVMTPASLVAGLTGSAPDSVNGVSVTIGDVSVAATVNAVGGWRAPFTLGAGTYTATVRATFAAGGTATAQRTFTVAPAEGGPAAGTVAPGPGALQASVVKVARPRPHRAPLPSRVTGRVGRPVDGVTATPELSGASVSLQVRKASGAPWSTVDRSRVDKTGRFELTWKPKSRSGRLRVVLEASEGFAGSASVVPTAKISACKVAGPRTRWSVTCRTTVKAGSRVALLDGRKVVDRAKVRGGTLRLRGKGRVGVHTIEVSVGKRGRVRLPL